jgi:hypothetical protein
MAPDASGTLDGINAVQRERMARVQPFLSELFLSYSGMKQEQSGPLNRPRPEEDIEEGMPAEEGGFEDACLEWILVEDLYDPDTGAYDVTYECPEGGDVASYRSAGVTHEDGTGSFLVTYGLRDGTMFGWSYQYLADHVGGLQFLVGNSTAGEHYESYAREANGELSMAELWEGVDSTSMSSGIYRADGSYDSFYEFDDETTEADPDFAQSTSLLADGTVMSSHTSTSEGWSVTESYQESPDGGGDYSFVSDDLSTSVSPDYMGSYVYGPDGSGSGGYTQMDDDGGWLSEDVTWDAQGAVAESWVFNDGLTPQPVDQEGHLVYGADGSAEGTVTAYFEDGSAVTCQLHVAADGTVITDNCSDGPNLL